MSQSGPKELKRFPLASIWLVSIFIIYNLKELLESKKKLNYSITYHDPCHARKMQGVFKEPRELLKANYHFVEMSNPNACCGFGGSKYANGLL